MIKPLFSVFETNTLSVDTDEGRGNDYPSVVRDSSGRLICFYEKAWKSGRLSQSIVTGTGGLGVQVQAGDGEINGVSVVWSLANLTVADNAYTLIYVDSSGTVSQSVDHTSTLIKSVIVLAYIGSGSSSIVNIENVERTGTYIFSKRQVDVGGEWQWDDYEYRLNTGRQPTASYDAANDRVYLTFSRDGLSFVRVLDLTNILTWEYLPHYSITGGVIYPEPYQQNTSISKLGSGLASISFGELFPIAAYGVGYKVDSGVDQYVHEPYLNSSFNQYVTDGTIFCEIFEKVGSSYNLVDSFPIRKALTSTWRQFLGGYNKSFYLGVRLKHRLYVEEEFRTDPANYDTIYPYRYLTSYEDVYGPLYSSNVALGKTTAHNPPYNPSYPSSNAVDGNLSTRAITEIATGGWWKIDFGSVTSIGKIVIRKYATDRPSNYKIQTADDFDFTTNVVDRVVAIDENSSTITYELGSGINSRYLRLLHTGGTSQYIDLYEFEVYELVSPYELIGYDARCDEEIQESKVGAGVCVPVKTMEFDQLFKMQDDTGVSKLGVADAQQTKTAEYDQLFKMQDDSSISRIGASEAFVIQTS